MGNCIYCNKPAGFLRSKHTECETKRSAALTVVRHAATEAAKGAKAIVDLRAAWTAAEAAHAKPAEVKQAVIDGWERAVDLALDDGLLDPQEENNLALVQRDLGLTQEELERNGMLSRVVKAAVLRQVMEGIIPNAVTVTGTVPFNFQKTEQLVWLFTDVEYLEDKTRRHYVGASHGASIRIAKGLYYRVGAFKGHPVERTERVAVDQGVLGVTNKHVYFAGPRKSFRIRHDKIVSHMPYADGVGVVRDAATAKPQVFVTGDGWFTYNLLTNVAQL